MCSSSLRNRHWLAAGGVATADSPLPPPARARPRDREAKGRLSNAAHGDQHFLAAAARLVRGCTAEQVRRAPAKFASLCRLIKQHAVAAGRAKAAILPLRAAVGKLCATPSLLSPIHADLFQLCLLAKCYSAASPVIDADVTAGARGIPALHTARAPPPAPHDPPPPPHCHPALTAAAAARVDRS